MKIRVLLADSRRLIREGMGALLERFADIKVIASSEEGQAAIKLAEALSPDVALVNLALSAHAARSSIEGLRAASPRTRIIALTLSPTTGFIREILSAGASGCLTKDCTSDELLIAIRTVAIHKVYLSPQIAEAVVSGYVLQDKPASRTAALSAREKQILRQIADGESTKQIAAAIGVSAKTVETHRRRMMKKLGAHSVAELTKYALREGITSLEPHV
ncbi:MAG: helix-turn-helix transcriptional response regulator, LuxR family [Phycisphaerales bacterium]|jgi:DNA-binding NarL/FixJ family response regulator|nr:helix-turn-helix transcriptional response regulator, LuxR family [Phycisphaerales bacterium]